MPGDDAGEFVGAVSVDVVGYGFGIEDEGCRIVGVGSFCDGVARFHWATEVVVGLSDSESAIGINRGFEHSGAVAVGGGNTTLPIAGQEPPGECVGVVCSFSIGIAFVEEVTEAII